MLGDMYRDGVYVPENKTIAYRIYRRGMDVIYPDHSSDAYPANRMRLGECFMKGYGCRQDQKLALTLLTEAKGVFEEQSRAGRIYAGSGLKRTEALLTELMEAMKDKES
jgi:TPR repeat protein